MISLWVKKCFLRLVITLGFTSVKDMPGINSVMSNPYKVDIGISAHGTSSDIFTSYDMLKYT